MPVAATVVTARKNRNIGRALHVEVDAGREIVLAEGFADRGHQDLEDHALVLELHLGLGGMDVDVHPFRLGFQVKEVGGGIFVGHQFLVGLAYGLVEERRTEIAAVHEEELVAGALAGVFRVADVSADSDQRRIDVHFHELLGQVHAVDVEDAFLPRSGGPQVMDLLAIGRKPESDLRPDQGDAEELLDDGPELGSIGLQELAAGRNVIEKVADSEIAAGRGRYGCCRGRLRVGNFHLYAHLVIGTAGLERHFRDSCYRGEGFAAESVGQDPLQVFSLVDLARGVSLEAEDGIVGRHAATVVNDLDKRLAGVEHGYADAACARIHGVLHQLLHHRGGASHHLTGGDQVRYVLREYFQHQFTSKRMKPFDR